MKAVGYWLMLLDASELFIGFCESGVGLKIDFALADGSGFDDWLDVRPFLVWSCVGYGLFWFGLALKMDFSWFVPALMMDFS